MKSSHVLPGPIGEKFVDARAAAYVLNLPMYYLTHAKQRAALRIPHYHIGRMVRFKLSELSVWLDGFGGKAPSPEASSVEVSHD